MSKLGLTFYFCLPRKSFKFRASPAAFVVVIFVVFCWKLLLLLS